MKNNELGIDIPDYDNYVITSEGDVWSFKRKKPRKLKPQKVTQSKKGYLQVRLFNEDTRRGKTLINGKKTNMGKLYYVHRLVWETFVGGIPEDKEIDHKDGNPHNNSIDNLQVITRRENLVKYAYKSAKRNGRRYLRDYRDEVIDDFRKLKSMPKVAEKWNCSVQHIRRIIKNIYYKGNEPKIFDESINDIWMNEDLRNIKHNEKFWL